MKKTESNSLYDFVKSQFILFGILIAALIFFIWQFFSQKRKTDQASTYTEPPLPNGGYSMPPGFENTAKQIAARIFQVIDDWFVWSSAKETAFKDLYALSDDELVYVYRTYNSIYFAEHNETMTKAIQNEWYYTNSTKNQLVQRLIGLNCI